MLREQVTRECTAPIQLAKASRSAAAMVPSWSAETKKRERRGAADLAVKQQPHAANRNTNISRTTGTAQRKYQEFTGNYRNAGGVK